MIRYIVPVSLSLAVFLIAGCGNDGAAPQSNAEPEDRETVFDPMVENIDRAKEIEELAKQRKAEMDERLKQMESGADPEN